MVCDTDIIVLIGIHLSGGTFDHNTTLVVNGVQHIFFSDNSLSSKRKMGDLRVLEMSHWHVLWLSELLSKGSSTHLFSDNRIQHTSAVITKLSPAPLAFIFWLTPVVGLDCINPTALIPL